MPLPAGDFYAEYHGHKVPHLRELHEGLLKGGKESFLFLAGDSSLDNKHWFFNSRHSKQKQLEHTSDFVGKAVNGYEQVLRPPHMVKDVCYWLNVECSRRADQKACCINTAVEESCLQDREVGGLLPQDDFIRNHITEKDVLIVDVGGNDIALRPTKGVLLNMALLIYTTPTWAIKSRCAPGTALGLCYFIHMFRVRLRRFIEQLVQLRKPKKVLVCMLYFLDEKPGGSWCDGVLNAMGYDSNPAKLQAVIRKVFSWATSQIQVDGTEVVPVPLYEVLDGKDSSDYTQRVEPSVQGGRKIAEFLAEKAFS